MRLIRSFVGLVRFVLSGGVLLVIAVMLLLSLATLVFAPLSAAAGAMLARAGITTVADSRASRLATAESRLAAQSDDLARAERRVAAQADELATANRRLAAQANELAAARTVRYRGQSRTVREAVSDTADRLSRRTARAAARNLAATPAEAVPFFGIAVIAGATAWELSDACALMGDVHELNVAFDPSLANDPERYEVCEMEVPTPAEITQRMLADPEAALAAQPEDYGILPEFDAPGWWDRAISWLGAEPGLVGPAIVAPEAVGPDGSGPNRAQDGVTNSSRP